MKTAFKFIRLCALMLAMSTLWFAACVSEAGKKRGLEVEEPDIKTDITIFPQLGHRESVNSAAFSPDGEYILSGSGSMMKIWEAKTGREIRTFFTTGGAAAFSPDGKHIISASSSRRTLTLWDVETGQEIRTFSGHTGYVTSVAFSPDGKHIISASYSARTLTLWETETGKVIKSFEAWGEVTSVAFDPNGTHIITGSSNRVLKLWDIEKGREIRTFLGHSDSVRSVAFSPDGKRIISGSFDNTVKLWEVSTGREIRTFRGRNSVWSVAFSPDGKYILAGSGSGNAALLRLWDVETGQEIRTFSGHTDLIDSVAFSPDGKQALSGSWDNTLKIWDVETGQEIRTFSGHSSSVNSVAFSPDGIHILFGSDSKSLKLWDANIGQEIKTFSGHTKPVTSVTFSHDGKYALSGSHDGTLRLWDMETGREIRTFFGRIHVTVFDQGDSETRGVYSVAFSPDGRQALSGSHDGTLRLWDVETGQEIRTFSGHTRSVYSVAFSPDGKQALSGSSDKTLKIWDVETGREIRTFSGHTSSVNSVAFSPDGKQALSGSWDNTFKIWDVKTGREIRTSGTRAVFSVVFSPDGKHIISASYGGTLTLWDAETGSEIRSYRGHHHSVNSVAFSPDGRQAISGSGDGTTRIWDVATGKELTALISFSGSETQLAAASRGLTVETQTAATSNEGEWLSITPDGYYQASPRGDRYLNVRVGNTVSGIDAYRSIFYNPDVVQARLQGRPDPASKARVTIQQAASFTPPTVTIQSPANFSTTNTATANLSVAIASQGQPVKNIKIIVNGRLIGRDELRAVTGTGLQPERASLTVTGSQKTVNFTLPLELDPGNNRIEVVAFNGYSENRRYVDVTRNAPAGERPAPPNLWIVAVGVNRYDNAGIKDLNFAVADAKGLAQSLKTQEGRRYGKVNVMLIADGESLSPTTANIRQAFKFLEGAAPRRDVVVLFLAGHGISAQEGKFFFLPRDAAMNGNTVDASRAISGDEIIAILDAPGNRLVFIDACNSGGVDSDRMVRSLMDTNAFVFTASRGTELSYEDPELGHGFFTHSVLTALGGAPAALAEGRNVSVLSMSGFVKDDVPKRVLQKYGRQQNPSAYSLGFYDFPMAVIRQ